jgi:hypothetical protein
MVSWLSASKIGLHCTIIGTLGLIVDVVVVVAVVLVVGCGLSSFGSRCPILHSRLVPCGCYVVGADSLCSFLLACTLYQKFALPFSFTSDVFFF